MMDIAEVSRRTGLAASALRYYEDRGLITSEGRRGLMRLFDPSVIERLSLIGLGRASGFSLDEIGAMLGDGEGHRIDKQKLADKADAIDRRIQQLTRMRDGLRHAAACRAPGLTECPNFRRIMRFAGQDAARPESRRRFRATQV